MSGESTGAWEREGHRSTALQGPHSRGGQRVALADEAGWRLKGLSVWPQLVHINQARAWLDILPLSALQACTLPPYTHQLLSHPSNKDLT